ncbi:DapH/DapD/GlmU-related protein [Gordonia phosphorivorans]|uniref:Acetyltransferase n=1 Tax=Gordonia phosphorivorans TaxID=1056982 RepID=A0ABV6HBK2_9ACTN
MSESARAPSWRQRCTRSTTTDCAERAPNGPAPISIGDNCWLGSNVTVGAGVVIGRNTVVGAGSVVVRDLPDHVVAVGSPARPVRSLPAEDDRP